jgi:hypothetical protein
MRNLFETEYISTITSNNNLRTNNTMRLTTRSILDTDFEEDDEDFDEVECYISEKPANREIDVMAWWKVIIVIYGIFANKIALQDYINMVPKGYLLAKFHISY